MKKRCMALVLCALLVSVLVPGAVAAEQKNTEDIIILYENDVHCAVEGYTKLAAMKQELKQSYAHVGVVSGGDFIQGSSLGAISQGQYIVDVMNLVGYDAVTLGNHEFDYRLERLNELVAGMDTKPVCCNFRKIGEENTYFQPYTIVSYGDVDIAYIGIATPSTLTKAVPTQFKDENGEFIYTFCPTELYDVVQANIDSAKAAGADHIIALSHIGYAEDEIYGDLEDVEDLIRNTDGFDVVLDAHSHSVIEGKTLVDEGGNQVLLTSTGTKFAYIGKLTVSDGGYKTELIKTGDFPKTDPAVDAYIQKINAEYAVLGQRKVATGEVDLITKDASGKRLVRRAETNLGDLCAEAFRSAVGADIGYINGGGIRADIAAGDITFNDLLAVLPFNNTVVKAQVDGQTILDMMEMAMMLWPEENGSFPHLSGLTFSLNADIPTSVVLDEQEEFVCVDGPYRVYDVKVRDQQTGEYKPLDPKGTYTIASHNYALIDHGSGMKMLEAAVVVQDDGMLDVEALERCVTEDLGGTVGKAYQEAQPSITFTGAAACPGDESCPLHPYPDLDKTQWYHDGMHYCVEKGLLPVAGADGLQADRVTTRAQFIYALWRLEGAPKVEAAEGFDDVSDHDWYSNAVRWASAGGIAAGYGQGIFGPKDAITREQMATVLYQYCTYKNVDVTVGEDTNILSYADAFDISGWAMEPMQWACGAGAIQAVDKDNTLYLEPQSEEVLGRSAETVYRFCTRVMN